MSSTSKMIDEIVYERAVVKESKGFHAGNNIMIMVLEEMVIT